MTRSRPRNKHTATASTSIGASHVEFVRVVVVVVVVLLIVNSTNVRHHLCLKHWSQIFWTVYLCEGQGLRNLCSIKKFTMAANNVGNINDSPNPPSCCMNTLRWLTEEAGATSWPSPKHGQPDEGCKEPAPRAIKFRKSRQITPSPGLA